LTITASIIRGVSAYRVREATLDDLDALVHHRVAMFTDMGVELDARGYVEAPSPMMFKVAPPGLAKPGGFR
jgi:hypothetical protein